MVSPIDGPGPPPGTFLPVPTDARSVVPSTRSQTDDPRSGGAGRRGQPIPDAVATPVGQESGRQTVGLGNPFLERPDAFRRPLFTSRPTSSFLAQAIGQDGARPAGPGSEEAARRYRAVQETVDRDVARRAGPPGVDIVT